MEPLVPMANLLQRSLCWQRAPPALRPRGGLEAGSTALSINHPDLRGSPALGRNAGRAEGTQSSAGVILDALSPLPRATPCPGPACAGKSPWSPDLQRMWALGGGQASRMGGQAQAGPFLRGGRTQAGSLAPQALLFASAETPQAMSLIPRSPTH